MTAIKCENCGHVQRILRRNTEVTQCSKCHKKVWVKASITKEPLTRNFTYLTKSKYAFNIRCWNCGKGFNPKNLRDARIEVVCPMCRKLLSEDEIKRLKSLNKKRKLWNQRL